MGRSQTTFQKRQRELRKIKQREEKAAKRRERGNDPQREALKAAGIDPDLHGITAGAHNNEELVPDDAEIELDGVGGVIISK